ncbi:hypothetical protein [Peptoniphilus sp. DNF00840]|uniref:hypothetical protein n=1 Tax=Peptoniphilus sp. DNF00840 TaxID=1477000 RepID=UPI0007845EB3|nr:hypothetical protein [Peptoniphilus sp. DNF00840]KXB70063.1 hypothetical protein HMPREF1864_01211 [Peptoniphilus sp. DNF00840]
MKKYVNLIISLFCFPIFNLIYLKVFEYINGKIQETFDIKYMIILFLFKILMILFLGFMLAYYFNFASKQEKKKLGIFLLIEIFILIIYVVTKKYYLPENFFYIFDFNLLYFMLLLGENIFLFLHFKKLE